MMTNTLEMIQQSYGDPENPNKEKICRDIIFQWMKEENLNTLGALYSCLLKDNYTNRIFPSLEFHEYKKFFLRYYQCCLVENNISDDPESYLMSRYEAGWDMANWILSLQDDKSISKKELNDSMLEIKEMLEDLYISGDEDLRNCLITAIFEHIFVNKKILHYFKGWNSKNILKEAYRLSFMYSRKLNNK